MSDQYSPEAGWYDDPERALMLRWWDGVRWTTHTRAKPVVEQPVAAAAWADMSSADALAVPGATVPYTYSAPYSWSPAMPSAAEPIDGSTAGLTTQSYAYVPERSNTPAAWALAVTPVVTVLAQAAALVLSGFESTSVVWVIGASLIPILWLIIWVRRDRITLHEWGHLRRAHWGWAFLGDVGYLTARTFVVRRQALGTGWWPLVLNLSLIALFVNIGLFTPVFGVLQGIAL
jgi:hypothetical protein